MVSFPEKPFPVPVQVADHFLYKLVGGAKHTNVYGADLAGRRRGWLGHHPRQTAKACVFHHIPSRRHYVGDYAAVSHRKHHVRPGTVVRARPDWTKPPYARITERRQQITNCSNKSDSPKVRCEALVFGAAGLLDGL